MKPAPLKQEKKRAPRDASRRSGTNFERLDDETRRVLDYVLSLRIASLEIQQSSEICKESREKAVLALALLAGFSGDPLEAHFTSAAIRRARTAYRHIGITYHFVKQRNRSKGDKAKRYKRDLAMVQELRHVSEATVRAANRAYLRFADQFPESSPLDFFRGMRAALTNSARPKKLVARKKANRE